MQIVIDMPDDICNRIRHLNRCVDFLDACRDRDKFVEAIKNGTPLPKGHGDLIDRGQALNECYDITIDGDVFTVVQYETLLGVPTIIEADKEEQNGI